MKLAALRIYRSKSYSTRDPSYYYGHAEFNNELGKIELMLNDEQINQILSVCADSLISISKAAAAEMTVKAENALSAGIRWGMNHD